MKSADQNRSSPMSIDLVNRFARTSIQGTFNLSGRVISLATNSPDLLSRMANLAAECEQADVGPPDCFWRIVTEPETDEALESVALWSRYVGDADIAFVAIGQRSFLAYDERTRKGVSFVSEGVVRDPTLFAETFLPSFLSLLWEGNR
jgi:hypothetical protein